MTKARFVQPAVLLLCLFGLAAKATAQTVTDERVWVTLVLQERADRPSKWRVSLESFVRSRDGVNQLDVAATRPVITYNITKHTNVGGGYAFSPSFPASGGVTVEHRVFQQFLWTGPASGGTLTLRTRLEERFIEGNSGMIARLREQFRFSHPFRTGSKFSVVGYDELFLALNTTTKGPRGVDHNRAFGGISVTASPAARFEIGYLNQFIPGHTKADTMNHVLAATFVVSF